MAEPVYGPAATPIEVVPVVVLSQVFPARPSSIPDIRDFVRRCLAESPLTEEGTREVGETVFRALLDAESASAENTPQIDGLRAELNRQYEAYLRTYGPLNRSSLRRTGRIDPATGEEARARIRPPQGGFIVRTACEGVSRR